jgi:tetratricopeptide (TPR) repeat protein
MTHRQIEIQMDGQRLPARAGEQVQSILKRYPPKADLKVVAAKINQNLAAYRQLAQAYEEQGQKDEAVRYYQRILDLEPGESEIEHKIEQLKGTA